MFGEIRNEQGERLDYTYHEGNDNRIVVIGHGVTGNKDRPALIALADGLADAGISALRFSFSGNGESEGAFTDSTITKEVTDLGSVIDVLSEYKICYVGHSMGGAVGVLRAASDERIEVLVSLAGMVHTKAFADREFGDVIPDEGFMWDEPDCPLSQIYIDDMTTIDSVAKHASKFAVPWLLVHGSEDDIVPIQDSIDILNFANEPTELLELPGVDHVFSDDGTPIMVEKVVAWISKKL
ncbi:prolyl oligopeptidase family serine peptidase [Candidatus Poribacteria bacterium]|nr:prolyl oligopeptidase family serine peptidase [Candidatus Poribacteria bacterium]